MNYEDMLTVCSNCGALYTDGHECPLPEDTPAKERRPSNYNAVYALLTRADKEQLDRIESKLDVLMEGK